MLDRSRRHMKERKMRRKGKMTGEKEGVRKP